MNVAARRQNIRLVIPGIILGIETVGDHQGRQARGMRRVALRAAEAVEVGIDVSCGRAAIQVQSPAGEVVPLRT